METAAVSDLRNYTKITSEVRAGHPVFLTKNGKVQYVLVDAEEYQFSQARERLMMELRKAEIQYEAGEEGFTTDEVRKNLGID